jgi:hypothetical protein
MTPNGGVDAAARIRERIAGPIILRNTLPPLASASSRRDSVFHRLACLSSGPARSFADAFPKATHATA